jgi:hypothetical protein
VEVMSVETAEHRRPPTTEHVRDKVVFMTSGTSSERAVDSGLAFQRLIYLFLGGFRVSRALIQAMY